MINMCLNIIFEHIMYILRSSEICCSGHTLSKKYEKIPFLEESFWDVKTDIRNHTFCLLTIKSHFLTIYYALGAFCKSPRILKPAHEIVCFTMKRKQYSICGLNPEISIQQDFFKRFGWFWTFFIFIIFSYDKYFLR